MNEFEKTPSGIGAKLLSYFERINASIYQRVNIAMICLTLSILLIVGMLSFGFMRQFITQNIRQTLESDAVQASQRIEHTMDSITGSLLNLSSNLIISNAIVDTVGRDAYIVPFMKGFKLTHDISVRLTLCDFMGKPLASSVRNPRAFNSPELLQRTIGEGKGFAELIKIGSETSLFIALPVIWVMTNKPEGVLVAELKVDELFTKTLPAFNISAARSISLLSGDTVLLQRNKKDGAGFFRLKNPLYLAPPLDKMAFRFEIVDYRDMQFGWLVGIYCGAGLLFIAATLWVSRTISLMLTGRLMVLSDMAKRIAESGSLEFTAEVKGSDEVTALATAFNAMVGKVREARNSLERRVEERTEQLFRTNEELNNEIRERERAEELIRRSLREKEVMLQEIHHRVKNNMQVIYSLLDLQARGMTDQKVRAMFLESRNRITSIALIHEKLYRSTDLAYIDFREYLQGLVAGITDTYNRPDVIFSLDMEPVALDVNVGIPCGLIVNEMVSNCLKHAFPDGRKGTIRLGVGKNSEGSYLLFVEDNGIGFPEGVDFRNTSSLGLLLVNVLTNQIQGILELSREEGTMFSITFPGTLKKI
jgi:two-component sensor histidine kinase/HAMP domain-containing protein